MSLPDERYRRGIEIQHRLSGGGPAQTANMVAQIAPDFARMTIELPLGDLVEVVAFVIPRLEKKSRASTSSARTG